MNPSGGDLVPESNPVSGFRSSPGRERVVVTESGCHGGQ